MLDMAFQLLAFFVLTFKPPPGEFQIYLKLPPAMKVLGAGGQAAGSDENKDPKDIKPAKTLTVSLLDENGSGDLRRQISAGRPDIGNGKLKPVEPPSMAELETVLRDFVQEQGYDQVVVQCTPTLRWEEVLKVTDICAKLTVGKTDKLPSLSYLTLGERKED